MRRRIIAMLSLVGALAAFTPVRAPADSLPRVFYTPAERAAITARRRAAVAPGETTASASLAAVADAAPVAAPSGAPAGATDGATGSRTLRLEGVTRGEGARAAAWIGGQRIEDGGQWAGFRLHVAGNGVRLVAANGSARFVRVGAEIDR